jgi:hypothetical protein
MDHGAGTGCRSGTNPFNVPLLQVAEYREIIEELRQTHGAAVTATLVLANDNLILKDADQLADAVCELLSFATKNTVFWIVRENPNSLDNGPIRLHRSLGGRARNFHAGWGIISDLVVTTTERRPELKMFIEAVLEHYIDQLRARLQTALTWINEAEHHHFIDLRFISLYIGIERLRIDFAPKSTVSYIQADWQKLLDGQLQKDVLKIIEAETGQLSAEQQKTIISKLRQANTPPATFPLEQLCQQLGVSGLDKEMSVLRNKLTHTASYGGFDFSKVSDLQFRLSHVVDLCVLKILGYDGYYCHKVTAWKDVRL